MTKLRFAALLVVTTAWASWTPALAAGPARFEWFEYKGADPVDSAMRPGPDEYRNPIVAGFHPDPSITRVGNDYYLVNSTFSWVPGLPIFHSRDLVNWKQIGNAIDRPGMVNFGKADLSRGLFAPTIRHHDGIFYIVNTCFYCGGNFVVTAKDPAGPWSDPVWLPDLGGGIDPSLFFDDDGKVYIVNNDVPPDGKEDYPGHRAIWIQEFDAKSLKTLGPRTVLVSGGFDISTKPGYIEGPHLFKKDGFYYLTAAEGGTGTMHAQMIWRSKSPTGPFTGFAGNPILTQRDLARDRSMPIEAAGHADLVETQNGDWWVVFLGIRPYDSQGRFNTGRETFLLPVTWNDGWPHILPHGKPIPWVHAKPNLPAQPAAKTPTTGPMVIRDEFDGTVLAPYWMTLRNLSNDWYKLDAGVLSLTPRPVGLSDRANPSLWARRQQHANASASTELRFEPTEPGDRAGLAIMQNDEFWFRFTLEKVDGKRVVQVARRAGMEQPANGTVLATFPMPGNGAVKLRVIAREELYDFEAADATGKWQTVLTGADGTILSTPVAGGFVGTLIGPFAQSGGK